MLAGSFVERRSSGKARRKNIGKHFIRQRGEFRVFPWQRVAKREFFESRNILLQNSFDLP
jgi:hypothetical protein